MLRQGFAATSVDQIRNVGVYLEVVPNEKLVELSR